MGRFWDFIILIAGDLALGGLAALCAIALFAFVIRESTGELLRQPFFRALLVAGALAGGYWKFSQYLPQ